MEPGLLFFTAFLVGLSGAMMPGPLTVVLVGHALHTGWRAAPLVTLGHGILEVLVIALLILGLGPFLEQPSVAGLLGLGGGGVLLWMGYGMLRAGKAGEISLQGSTEGGFQLKGGALGSGMLATLANPYWFLWWATVGAGFVVIAREQGYTGLALFFGGHLLSDFAWLSLLALAVVFGKRFLSDNLYRVIIMILGIFLMGMAVYFLWSGVNLLI